MTQTDPENWVYSLEPSRTGRSPSLSFRILETSVYRTPKVQSMVRSVIPSVILFFAHETSSLVKIDPILRIELQDTSCWAFDWANSEVVAIGCTNGGSAN
jgi:hypothetical protein